MLLLENWADILCENTSHIVIRHVGCLKQILGATCKRRSTPWILPLSCIQGIKLNIKIQDWHIFCKGNDHVTRWDSFSIACKIFHKSRRILLDVLVMPGGHKLE